MMERGENIKNVLDVMKSQPLVLGLLLVIFALIGFVYLQSAQFNTQRAENVKMFLDVQKEVQKLLSQCIVPPPKG
jgi:membrane-anchored glycerophosphoryl diester phosphodiesterase (GDPDase)